MLWKCDLQQYYCSEPYVYSESASMLRRTEHTSDVLHARCAFCSMKSTMMFVLANQPVLITHVLSSFYMTEWERQKYKSQ
jgi:hypothetical protein